MGKIRNYFNLVFMIILIIYSGIIDYNLPKFIIELFKNYLFRILILILMLYKSKKNLEISILIGIMYCSTMSLINNRKLKEKYRIELAD